MKTKITGALAALLMATTLTVAGPSQPAEAAHSHPCHGTDHYHYVVGNSNKRYRHVSVNTSKLHYFVIRQYKIGGSWHNRGTFRVPCTV